MEKKNGKGKEFNIEGNVIFEVEYKKGKKNGKQKGYDSKGILIFEGELINGEKKKGKEYNSNAELIFEGEYLKGLRWNGKGKEYNYKGELMFEVEYLNGQRWNGKGKEYIEVEYDEYKNEKAINELSEDIDEDRSNLIEFEYLEGIKKEVKNLNYPYD